MSNAWKHPPRQSRDLPMNELATGFLRFMAVMILALLFIVVGVLAVGFVQKVQDNHIHNSINTAAPIGRG